MVFLRRGIFQKVVVVETVCVVVVVKAICSPELAVDREDSERRGGGSVSVLPLSSCEGDTFEEATVPGRCGSSNVILLIRTAPFEELVSSRTLLNKVRDPGAAGAGIGAELSAGFVRKYPRPGV